MTTKVNKTRKPAGYWTEATVRAAATPYNTKEEFKKSGGAYQAAHKLGLINDLGFANSRKYWTESNIRKEASKYNTKTEFNKGSSAGFNAACKLGIIDDLGFPNLLKSWTESNIREEAAKYSTKSEFVKGCDSAYNSARRLGIIDDLGFTNLIKQTGHWLNEDNIREEASKYNTKKELAAGCKSCYNSAQRLGIIDDLGFTAGVASSDNDMFYIWRVVDLEYKGVPVYKYGMTSKRLGDHRIQHVAKRAGVQYDIILMVNVERATDLEVEASKVGERVDLGWPEGNTEVRALDDNELWSIKQMALSTVV